MMALLLKGKSIATDGEGYLKNREDWSEALAEAIAKEDKITLSDAHWELIHLVKAFYRAYEFSPAMRPLIKYISKELGKEKANSIYLMTLFPGSPATLLSKIAGLPRPVNCL